MNSAAARVCGVALLVAADTIFLWMFVSTDPIEQLASRFRDARPAAAGAALAFAADWRHGMAGNSWIYMPGFFLTAATVWLHSHRTAGLSTALEQLSAVAAAAAIALAGAGWGAAVVLDDFTARTGFSFQAAAPRVSAAGLFCGVYTLAAWSVFVLACRYALLRRTWRPFAAPAVLTAGLAMLRPCTADDFVNYWARGVMAGNASARLSLALVFGVAALLAAVERSTKPEPRQSILRRGAAAGEKHEDQVCRDGNGIEAR